MSDHAEVRLENFVVSPTKSEEAPPKEISELASMYEARIRQMFSNTQLERDGLIKENAVLKTKLRGILDENAELEAKLCQMRDEREIDIKRLVMERAKKEITAAHNKCSELEAKCRELEAKLQAANGQTTDGKEPNNEAADGPAANDPAADVQAANDQADDDAYKPAAKIRRGDKPATERNWHLENPVVNAMNKNVDDYEATDMVVNDAIIISDD